jgi:hypothetical protein
MRQFLNRLSTGVVSMGLVTIPYIMKRAEPGADPFTFFGHRVITDPTTPDGTIVFNGAQEVVIDSSPFLSGN